MAYLPCPYLEQELLCIFPLNSGTSDVILFTVDPWPLFFLPTFPYP